MKEFSFIFMVTSFKIISVSAAGKRDGKSSSECSAGSCGNIFIRDLISGLFQEFEIIHLSFSLCSFALAFLSSNIT